MADKLDEVLSPPEEASNASESPPPPPSKASPPPPPPKSDNPPPPEPTPPPPSPSKPKDNPPPEPTPPLPSPSPPPPAPTSKGDPPAPPPPEKAATPPPTKDSTPSPTHSSPPPSPQLPPPVESHHSPPSPPLPPSEKPSSPYSPIVPTPENEPHVPNYSPLPHDSYEPPTHLTPHAEDSPLSPSPSGALNNQVAVILGISFFGILILALIIVCFLRGRKKKQSYYYNKEGSSQDQFYNGTTQWHTPHSMEHVVSLAPPSGIMGTPVGNLGSSGKRGGVPPPLQAGVNYSNEYNLGYNSSGQHGGHGQSMPPLSPMTPMGLGHSQSQFSYEDLAAATAGFSQANLIGQGGFGYVHKGVLPDGKVVAVKSLKSGSGQGEREFQAEVEIISRVHHRHLVSLVGYCIADGQRMLVYEFVPNSTMEHHLHGKGQPVMDWSSRVRIAIGSAKGLAYLHEDCHPRIIHRDIKAANILLDANYEAMVADFGLAKLTTDNCTHVSTRVMGTFGYLAPEYASSGKLTEKSDVFSFGVMLLELITGRRPVDLTGQVMEDSLVDWARPLMQQALEDGNYDELADPKLEGNYDPNEMVSMISCAAASVRHSAKRRPKMSQIVRALEGDSILAENTNETPKTRRNKSNNASGSSSTHDPSYDTVAYNADMMKFRMMVMNSQDFGASTEFGTTSEYGLNQSTSSSSNNSKEIGVRRGQ